MWGYRAAFDTPEAGSHPGLGEGTASLTRQKMGLSGVDLPTEVGKGVGTAGHSGIFWMEQE